MENEAKLSEEQKKAMTWLLSNLNAEKTFLMKLLWRKPESAIQNILNN